MKQFKKIFSLFVAFTFLLLPVSPVAAKGLWGAQKTLLKATNQTLRIDAAGDGADFAWPVTDSGDMLTYTKSTTPLVNVTYASGAYTSFVRGDFTAANAFIHIAGNGAGGAAPDLSAYKGSASTTPYKILLTDSAGKQKWGYLQAEGTGTTVTGTISATELVTNGDFTSSTGWSTTAGWVVGSNVLTGTTVTTAEYRSTSGGTIGTLFLYFADLTVTSGTTRFNLGGDTFYPVYSTSGAKSFYLARISDSDKNLYINGSAFTGVYDNVSVKQVTEPPPSNEGGFRIVSVFNSTTRGWLGDATFNPNAIVNYKIFPSASYQGYVPTAYAGLGEVLYSNTVASVFTDTHRGDFVDGSAFFWAVGKDFSTYNGTDAGSTPYKVVLTDSAGKRAWGWIGANGSGTAGTGTLGSDLFPNNTAVSDSATEANATTGWSNAVVAPVTFESVSTGTPNVGSRHFHVVTNAVGGGIRYIFPVLTGQLLKIAFDVKVVSGSLNSYVIENITDNRIFLAYTGAAYTTQGVYAIPDGGLRNVKITGDGASSEFYVDNASTKRVTEPPANVGFHVHSTYNGTDRKWNIESGFNYNAIATYRVYKSTKRAKLVVYDPTNNKSLIGYIDAAGSGTAGTGTLGSELITNGNMETGDPPTGWAGMNATLSQVADERTGGGGSKALNIVPSSNFGSGKQVITTLKAQYYADLWLRSVDSGYDYITFGSGSSDYIRSNSPTWEHVTGYRTVTTSTTVEIQGMTAGNNYRVDDVSVKRITACPPQGVNIFTTATGNTRGWASKGTGFNYNGTNLIYTITQ